MDLPRSTFFRAAAFTSYALLVDRIRISDSRYAND